MREMYIHKRCRPEEYDLNYDMVEFGYCSICKIQGTIYYVKGTDDVFVQKKAGVTREFRDGEETGVNFVEPAIITHTGNEDDFPLSSEEPSTFDPDMGKKLMEEALDNDFEVPKEEEAESIPEPVLTPKEVGKVLDEAATEIAKAQVKMVLEAEAPTTEEEQAQSVTAEEPEPAQEMAVGVGEGEIEKDIEFIKGIPHEEETIESLKKKLAALEEKTESE